MARIKYYYDTETCKYERVKASPQEITLNILGFLFTALIFAGILVWVLSGYFRSPKEVYLEQENEQLSFYYNLLAKDLEQSQKMLASLQERDENIYRVVFEAEPIPTSVRNTLNAETKYKKILQAGLENDELIAHTMSKIYMLQRQMYIQTKSYDEIARLARSKAKMLASIPAIQPVHNKELTRLVSGFGMRIHPIYKVKKMHTGCDFAAPKGTPIYAAGDGIIVTLQSNSGGYGNEIEINHGYGYVTKYAHLDRFAVKHGQRIKRGEIIGYVGSTGSSTAPHLHYEVIHNGTKVNPVQYFFQDLNEEEYQRILELATIENQSLS
jgi:murein DD-endopeptidase MepM/ murein hydrolase activator NlpD